MPRLSHGKTSAHYLQTLPKDLTAGAAVFLVALPLCLGVALASGAPLFSGLMAGIIGGIVVGCLSGSHVSVSGSSPGLTVVVAAWIAALGSFEAFLLAVALAGAIQIVLGCIRAGSIAAFVPSGVIKGLLAAIGVILILKQIPHLLGHDTDPQGEMAFLQPDKENTFSELVAVVGDLHYGAALIGIASFAFLMWWENSALSKRSRVPSSLIVVVFGVLAAAVLDRLGEPWAIGSSHLVQVPIAKTSSDLWSFVRFPDISQWTNPAVYVAAAAIALVASLETLLNIDAVDKLDPQHRVSPPNRELIAQGIGNILAGCVGSIPISSVIVRSSVNINSGSQTKLSTIIHGVLLLVCVVLLPQCLNWIPLSCLAAILLVTGIKLASPTLIKQMWTEGRYQFIPFAFTVVAIVVTDLVVGVMLGLVVSLSFILVSNMRRPLRQYLEKHLGGDVTRIQLANQVSFLNRAGLRKALYRIPRGGHVLIDAQDTDYIDPDVLSLLREFKTKTARARGVHLSLKGFGPEFDLPDELHYVDHSTRELQSQFTPEKVLEILMEGNQRFLSGQRLTRDLGKQVANTSVGQFPLAVVLSCIDSRTPVELVFDLGLGDIFGIRIAGNILSPKVLGSMEYSCAVAGARLILVMGHTRCGAVTAAVDLLGQARSAREATGCEHLDDIVCEIQRSVERNGAKHARHISSGEKLKYVDHVARQNVLRVVESIPQQSETLAELQRTGRLLIVGAMYDVATGAIEILAEQPDQPTEVTQLTE